MNTWVGIGWLVRDPEVRYTQSGKAVCRFTLMGTLTQRTYEQNGEKKTIIEVVAREVDFGEKPRGTGASASSTGDYPGAHVTNEDIPC